MKQLILDTITQAKYSLSCVKVSKMSLKDRIAYETTKIKLELLSTLIYRFWRD